MSVYKNYIYSDRPTNSLQQGQPPQNIIDNQMRAKDQATTGGPLNYLDYLPTINEIDKIFARLMEEINRYDNDDNNNDKRRTTLEVDDYLAIQLSFMFKILKAPEISSGSSRQQQITTNDNDYNKNRQKKLKPFGEKGSDTYLEVLTEVIHEFISVDMIKQP